MGPPGAVLGRLGSVLGRLGRPQGGLGPPKREGIWTSVFAGYDGNMNSICPTTSVWGGAVDHMMLREREYVTVQERQLIPLFAPVGVVKVADSAFDLVGVVNDNAR